MFHLPWLSRFLDATVDSTQKVDSGKTVDDCSSLWGILGLNRAASTSAIVVKSGTGGHCRWRVGIGGFELLLEEIELVVRDHGSLPSVNLIIAVWPKIRELGA